MRRSPLLAAVLAVLLSAAPTATAAPAPQPWATINVCDTIAHPDSIGIRASMPGAARKGERMFMRFRVQYFRGVDHRWHNITQGADSGYIPVGSASFQARQAGRIFVFAPPAGGSFRLRGKVYFQWRIGSRIINRTSLLTRAGHRSAAGSDPPGYSAGTCVIT